MTAERKIAPEGRLGAQKNSGQNDAIKTLSQRVTEHSDALDLRQGVFKLTDPRKIAASLKRSAERSSRRKAGAYRPALSMLTCYINRAGKGQPKTQRERPERAKGELFASNPRVVPANAGTHTPCKRVRAGGELPSSTTESGGL